MGVREFLARKHQAILLPELDILDSKNLILKVMEKANGNDCSFKI